MQTGLGCASDADAYVDRIRAYLDAGFDHVYVHQIGPDQEGFMGFFSDEVLPRFS